MKIHKRLIVLVGLGMLLIVTITVFSLQNITFVFSHTMKGMERISRDVRRIWNIEKKIEGMSRAVHDFIESGEEAYRSSYETSRAAVQRMLDEMSSLDLSRHEMEVLASIMSDFHGMERKAGRIFALASPAGADRTLAMNLWREMDGLLRWMENDIEKYKEESALRLDDTGRDLRSTKIRINILFGVILLTSMSFLFGFGFYIHRKVSMPLSDLWEGAEAVSRGNLDYQVRLHGESDIVRLGERFNEMAQKLRISYADLERKLLDRTKQLAALNSVALALGQAGNLKAVLQKSLVKVLESLTGMEPRGGIFLTDPDGERLRLFANVGLSPEFVQQEETIHMGECLCGAVAQTGELLFTEEGCADPRHTRNASGGAHSHIIIPIKSRGLVLGVIFLYPEKHFTLRPSDIQMLDTIGAQLGMAVENLRLYGEVKESSEKYWDLFENSREIMFTMDTSGVLTSVNESTEKFFGYSKVELTGMNVLDFLAGEGKETARRALAGESVSAMGLIEFEVLKRDGSRAFVEISGRNMYQNRVLAGFQVAARDVTEQKTLREMLVKAERLAAIGQVGVAVRHEINNPLTTVIGNVELLLERHNGSRDDLKARLQVVLSNALRIAEIVKRLQDIRQDKTVEYLKGVKMTDLEEEGGGR